MAQGKCSLLKPVDSLTGTFFLFSQYAQDLTKQYSNPDEYRCVPSKYIALDLDFSGIVGSGYVSTEVSTEEPEEMAEKRKRARALGEIFQNYYENSCAFLRAQMENEMEYSWQPEYARTLLFQTLEKYGLIRFENTISNESNQVISGVSKQIQYIGDINIYSHNNDEDGIGYNEIYCYIPNEAKSYNYQCSASKTVDYIKKYEEDYICGYTGHAYNDMSWVLLLGAPYLPYIDFYPSLSEPESETPLFDGKSYKVGEYVSLDKLNELINGGYDWYETGKFPVNFNPYGLTLEPQILTTGISDDPVRENVDKFKINSIVVLYDIVSKTNGVIKHKNIPLGIYFTGDLDTCNHMSNEILKYVDSGQIYNQGTSYGLRICTRFLNTPNSTEIKEVTTNGSTNISEMAPVLEKMGETIMEIQGAIDKKEELNKLFDDHLSQFKNNKVNVPYIRTLGNKKYWFVNGKNTGAIAQYDYSDPTYIITETIKELITQIYTKSQIDAMLQNYCTIAQHDNDQNLLMYNIMREINQIKSAIGLTE